MSQNKNMIYIHVPFCASRCIYCDFYSTTLSDDYKKQYVQAACAEIIQRHDYLPQKPLQSIYFGGGTPSLLSINQIEQLLSTILKNYSVESDAEITIEANPDDVNSTFAQDINSLGVNRVSLGVQSFDDYILHLLNRRHTAHEAEVAVHTLYNHSICNISIDLIYGLPSQTLQQFESDLDKAFSLPIKHLSSYALSIEKGTILYRKIANGELSKTDEDLYIKAYAKLIEKAKINGFEHYEISNFAKPGFYSRHNSGYWDGTPYLGIGPGAHSFNGGAERRFNLPDIKSYIKANGEPAFNKEILTDSERFDELIFTSLRTQKGLELNIIKKSFPFEWYKQLMCDARPHLISQKLVLTDNNEFLKLTEKGIMTSNDIISDLMRAD